MWVEAKQYRTPLEDRLETRGRKRTSEERVLQKILLLAPAVDAIVLHQDTDGKAEMRTDYQAAAEITPDHKWLFAIPHPTIEAWILWACQADREHQSNARDLVGDLGVNPILARLPSRDRPKRPAYRSTPVPM